MEIPENLIPPDPRVLATELEAGMHYARVVLREDQLELIRLIVREEVRAALDDAQTIENPFGDQIP